MEKDKLNILWTNDNPVTSKLMVMMYATNAMKKGFWKEVTVIIWGATAKLAAQDAAIQDLIAEAREAGVRFSACKACADQLGASEALRNLGIELIYWGAPLTEIIKNKENLLTV